MRTLSLIAIHLRVVLMNDMQYRANFFFYLLHSLVALGTGLLVLGLVFTQVEEIRGWSPPRLIVVLGVFTLLGGFIRMVIKPNLVKFMEDVRDGTLDYLLVKPIDSQLLVSIRAVSLWNGLDIPVGVVVILIGAWQLEQPVSAANALTASVALLFSVLLVYSFLTILATASFRFIQVEPIVELFDGIYQAGRWPIGLYPGWLRLGLTFVVPIGVAVTVPAEALTGRLSLPGLALLASLGTAMFLLARVVWVVGVRRYSSASS